MIVRYESCIGLSLPHFGRYKIEIWYCSRKYHIQPHSHPDLDIKLMFLFGHNTTFFRSRNGNEVSAKAKWWNIGKVFTILRNDNHWFTVSNFPLIFMNIEKWYSTPTSASESFKIYGK